MESKVIYEACVESIQQCLRSEELGADRIELCADLAKGGTTPSYGLVKQCKERVKIPVFIIIRPRGGNFVHDDLELSIMEDDIRSCLNLGVEGLVFGILTKDNQIDIEANKRLVELARGINNSCKLTFHMAFDDIEGDRSEAISQISKLGFNRILTKGSKTNASDGIDNLKLYIEYSRSFGIEIMPGGGITKDNREKFENILKCNELHGTKIVGNLN
jgi:copper homeostasis protein